MKEQTKTKFQKTVKTVKIVGTVFKVLKVILSVVMLVAFLYGIIWVLQNAGAGFVREIIDRLS